MKTILCTQMNENTHQNDITKPRVKSCNTKTYKRSSPKNNGNILPMLHFAHSSQQPMQKSKEQLMKLYLCLTQKKIIS